MQRELLNRRKLKMDLDAKRIKTIYSGLTARHYDLPISHFFGKYKKMAFNESSLKSGDRVLVFCCGTGLDFSYILKKIGSDGKIVGVDFSSEMLKIAEKRVKRKKWENVDLIEADITKLEGSFDEKFDVGVCTLGMSIIPEYETAYNNLVFNTKKQGEIIIGDIQLASGKLARLNPLTIFLARRYGGSYKGHQNSKKISDIMKEELSGVVKKEFFFKSYYHCIGKAT
jgi:ubiquinone/menaquinone biosynthesis C-methylase UbiE